MSLIIGAIIVIAILLICLLSTCIFIWSKQSIGGFIGLPGNLQTHVITLSDHKTTVRVLYGNATKSTPPVILIGSCPLDQRMWDPVLNEVSKAIMNNKSGIPTFITYDSRGCGTADFQQQTSLNTDIAKWSKDLDLLLNQLEIDKVVLAGWGFGGLVAQHFALTNSSKVSKLYVFSVSSTDSDGAEELTNMIDRLEQWRNQNLQITYLTLHETMVQEILCKWFENCGHENEFNIQQIREICQDSLRELNVDDYLLTLKLIRDSQWLIPLWLSNESIPFKTYLMSASNDKFAHPTGAIDLFNAMKKGSKGKWITMDVKQGLHGYALAHAEETAKELIGL